MLTAKPYHWYCLLASIALEVGGTLIMKLAQGWAFAHAQMLGLVVMWLAIGLSYIFLSRAVTGIPVGVTFALWEGLGLTCITLGGIFFLGEAVTLNRALGLACVLGGGCWLTTEPDTEKRTNLSAPQKVQIPPPHLQKGATDGLCKPV